MLPSRARSFPLLDFPLLALRLRPLRLAAGWLAALAAAWAPPARAADAPPLTLRQIVSRAPSLNGTAPAGIDWSPDGSRLAFTWNDRALPGRDLWVVERDGTGLRNLPGAPAAASADRAPPSASLVAGQVAGSIWAPDGRSLAVLAGGEVWRIGLDGAAPVRLTQSGGEKSELGQTPDGRALIFLRDGDLFLVPATGGAEERLTRVGRPPIGKVPLGTYYHSDVEVGGAAWGEVARHSFSPDGKTLAVHHVDRTAVRRFPIPHYLGPEALLNELRRGAPGDVNERRSVGLVDLEKRTLTLLPLPEPERWRIVWFGWSRAGALVIDRETDDAVDRVISVLPRPGAPLRELWRDHGPSRIYNDIASALGPGGDSLLVTGDLDDRYRLYSVPLGAAEKPFTVPGAPLPVPLTEGPSDVEGAAQAAGGAVYYLSSAPRPEERHVFRLHPGGAPEQVTRRPGTHSPHPAPDGRALALVSSDDVTPPELFLLDVATGQEVQVTRSPPPVFAGVRLARPRYLSFPGATAGVDLHARVLEPPATPGARRPVIVGPVYTNRVRNRWDPRWSLLEQLLVQRGYVVAQLDSRGSTGYGRAFREKFLQEWGRADLDDYADLVGYLKSRPGIDPARFGIFGSSYGGTVAVHALLRRPGLFTAAVAGAPAVDPRYFGSDDVAVARTPAQSPEVFQERRAAALAGNLQDHLMIIHGLADDVVPFQTSVQLAQALIDAGKEFDLVVAPGATHRWTGREADAVYLLGKLVGHFDRWLAPPPPAH
jgi:dipeptidyl-peptidase-4